MKFLQVRQLSGLTYITDHREIQIVYDTGHHRLYGGHFLQHTRSAAVGQVCRTRLTTVERVIDFDLGGLPLCRRSPKGEMTYYHLRSTILQNFCPIAQSTRYALPKFFTFRLRGLTPGPKSTKRVDDLVDT